MEARLYSDRAAIAANQNVKEREYWLEQLSGELVKSRFPYDRIGVSDSGVERFPGAGPAGEGDSLPAKKSFTLPADLVSKLEKISGGIDIKLHMVLVAGLVLLLHKYTGSDDILTGAPILKQETETDFINRVLVSRNRLRDEMTFKELLLQVRETIVNASQNQNFPMEVLPDLLKLPVVKGEFPLFDAALVLENIHTQDYLKDIDYHMLFSFRSGPGRIEGFVEYYPGQYSRRMIKQIVDHYARVLDLALSDLSQKPAAVDMLSAPEKQQLLEEFNASDCDFPGDKTFGQLFEEQVGKTPRDTAVVAQSAAGREFGAVPAGDSPGAETAERELSYAQLNEKAGRLALVLRERGLTAGTIAAVMTERSLEMIIGVLAVIKAGGAYLPVDPGLPAQRIEYMLLDSAALLLVTRENLKEKVNFNGEIITIENERFDRSEAGNPEHVSVPTGPVYVIYTSGSTGKPKGVMVQHSHFINLAFGWRREYGLQEIEVNLLQMAGFSFDVFAGDLARAFLNGGKMVITPELAVAPESLYELIKNHRITLFESTPAYIIPFMQYVYENNLDIESLQLLILGSDICPYRDFKELVVRFGKRMRIINSYGVTEATIDSSYYEEDNVENIPAAGNVPIGTPLPNVKFYVLDRAGNPLPLGVPGELYIGGKSVTRGYLNNPELTAEKFVSIAHLSNKTYRSNISQQPGPPPLTPHRSPLTLYKTGDLARWLPDGNMEFLGRIDYQVKVRGYRIELGEIESKLLEHPHVKEAVVVEKKEKNDDKYLCGYFVSEKKLEMAELRDYLGQKLPAYMVPWFFVRLEALPLTANGKIDRRALPDPEASAGAEYVAPRDEKEKELVGIWSQVLEVEQEQVGIDHNFFDLGGNSLRAIVISSRIHKKFDVKVQLVDIFQLQTVRKLAGLIDDAAADRFTAVNAVEKKEYYELSSAQKRLYVLQQMNPDSIGYNMPESFILQGDYSEERLTAAFKRLIRRHEVFRTSIEIIAGEPKQKIHDEVDFHIEYKETAGEEAKKIMQGFIKFFDLSRAPLLRAALMAVKGEGYAVLVVDMHHIVTDAFSNDVLKWDFMSLLEGKELPPLRLQYKDFSEWQNRQIRSGAFTVQEKFWLEEFSGELPLLDLPLDFPRPEGQSYAGSTVNFALPREQVRALRELISEQGVTMQILMLALLNILLAKISGQEDIVIGTPAAGRRHVDLESIIGAFINTLAFRNFPGGGKGFTDFLKEVKERSFKAYENQDYPFEILVNNLQVNREQGRNPLFDVMFEIFSRSQTGRQSQRTPEPGETRDPIEPLENRVTKMDIDWYGIETEDDLFFVVFYSTALFKRETVEKLGKRYREIIDQVLHNKNIKIKDIVITHSFETAQPVISKEEGDFGF
ncbi:MAG: amino acid adenylation domain-containing protein [Candidatus Aminicenantes bacterium]|nr:amino acid adenylation domain-containing protein [Candidatus Aminicenantes bacterium]